MKKVLYIILKFLLFVFLTVVTQIGGLVYLLSLLVAKKWKVRLKYKTLLVFTGFYLIATFLIVPLLAPVFGREKVQHTDRIKPTNYMTVVLNRNYVCPSLNLLLLETEKVLKGSAVEIHYLDANFPFINKFPLLPHLSHNDGKKLDLSLIYETSNGQITNKQKSLSGYGVFEGPKASEVNQIDRCLKAAYFQYDYPKYMSFGEQNSSLVFSEKGSKILIKSLLKNPALGKLFIEPHLKNRMGLANNKIRYHGCKSVRHDDHIHIQLK